MILVSVIIPFYNSKSSLARCLESVLKQEVDFKVEIICVDDGSTDSSNSIVQSYGEHISLIEQKNKGQAAARNAGLKLAQGRYISFLDADDYWLPNFLSVTVNYLESNSSIHAVSVAQKHMKLDGSFEINPNEKYKHLFKENDIKINDFFSFYNRYNFVCTGSVTFRRELAELSKGQNERFRMSQDIEYWALLSTLGKWAFIPQVLFVSDGHEVSSDIGFMKKYEIRWKSVPHIDLFMSRINKRLGNRRDSVIEFENQRLFQFLYFHIMAKETSKAIDVLHRLELNGYMGRKRMIIGLLNRIPRILTIKIFQVFRYFQLMRYSKKYG